MNVHDVFLSKMIINIQCETLFSKDQNIKAELCVLVYIFKRHDFILIFDPENIGLDNFKNKFS